MPLYSEPYNNLERGYNDDNGNPSEPYNLQWGLDRRRAAPAAPAQQGGNSPEVERALAMARHQVQLEKERQAQVQAEEIQKRIQAGILRERAERAKARQAQAAKKKQQQQQQKQQAQPQTQQPQTQTPANQPQAQTQQPQAQTQAPANQPTQQPQAQPQAQTQPPDSGYSQMAPDRGDWNPYVKWLETQRGASPSSGTPQAPVESEGDRRLRELQERDRRMLRLGPQGGDIPLPPVPPSQQPQTQTQPSGSGYPQMAPDRGDWNPYVQWLETQRGTPPSSSTPQASAESEGDRRLRELQARDQRMLDLGPQGGDISLPPAPTNQQPQTQPPVGQDFDPRDLFGPVGTSPMNSGLSEGDRRLRDLQERDQRMLRLGPQNGDVNLLGWLWNKFTGPSPEDYSSQSMSVPSETWRYETPADLVNPATPDGKSPEPGAVNRFFDDVGTALQNKRDWFTAPPAEPDPRRDLFGPVGTSPMNGGPGVDPNAPYGPLPPERKGLYNPAEKERLLKELQERDRYYQEYYDNMKRTGDADRNARLYPFLGAPQGGANGPDVEADPDMPVVVDTGPNMDPGIEAPGSAAPGTHPEPGVHQIPQEIPAEETQGLDTALQPGATAPDEPDLSAMTPGQRETYEWNRDHPEFPPLPPDFFDWTPFDRERYLVMEIAKTFGWALTGVMPQEG